MAGAVVAAQFASALLPPGPLCELTDWRLLLPPDLVPTGHLTITGGLDTLATRVSIWATGSKTGMSVPLNKAIAPADRFGWMLGSWGHGVFMRTDSPTVDLIWNINWQMLRLITGTSLYNQAKELNRLLRLLPSADHVPTIRVLDPARAIWIGGNLPVMNTLLVGLANLKCQRLTPIEALMSVTRLLAVLTDTPKPWSAIVPAGDGFVTAALSTVVTNVLQSKGYAALYQDAVAEYLDLLNVDENASGSAQNQVATEYMRAFNWLDAAGHPAAVKRTSHLFDKAHQMSAISPTAQDIMGVQPTLADMRHLVEIRAAASLRDQDVIDLTDLDGPPARQQSVLPDDDEDFS